jgi:RimK family alpha-L-glutamate ligase
MRLGIISRHQDQTMKLFSDALRKKGCDTEFIKISNLEITTGLINELEGFDLIFYYGGLRAVGRQALFSYLHSKNIPVLNESLHLEPSIIEKVYQVQKAYLNGVNVPKTLFGTGQTFETLSIELGDVFIAKPSRGSKGVGVSLIESAENLESFRDENGIKDYIMQSFIKHNGDYRIYVIGGKAVCGYERVASDDDFRGNVSVGAKAKGVNCETLKGDLFKMAEDITSLFKGVDIAGIDILRDTETGGLYFLEINMLPGYMAAQKATGIDVADLFATHIVENYTKNN